MDILECFVSESWKFSTGKGLTAITKRKGEKDTHEHTPIVPQIHCRSCTVDSNCSNLTEAGLLCWVIFMCGLGWEWGVGFEHKVKIMILY